MADTYRNTPLFLTQLNTFTERILLIVDRHLKRK